MYCRPLGTAGYQTLQELGAAEAVCPKESRERHKLEPERKSLHSPLSLLFPLLAKCNMPTGKGEIFIRPIFLISEAAVVHAFGADRQYMAGWHTFF